VSARAGEPPQAGIDRQCSLVNIEEWVMGKGMDRKKEEKKKPTKTLEEKRAAKREKKAARG
jgi:hypothetical protein